MRIYSFISIFSLLFLLSGCDSYSGQTEDLPIEGAIGFAISAPQTRSEFDFSSSELTSMGVFAAHTQGEWDDNATPAPNVMFNQLVEKLGQSAWNYSPMKYWPANASDKVSFFAYAPYATQGLTTSPADKNGYPQLFYTVPVVETQQQDLLVADPKMNLTQQSGQIPFKMRHALTKVNVYVQNTSAFRLSALSVHSLGSGCLTFNATGFSWSLDPESQQEYTASLLPIEQERPGRFQIATFYMLPIEEDNASFTLKYSYLSTSNTWEEVEFSKALPTKDKAAWVSGASLSYTIELAEENWEGVKVETGAMWAGTEKDIQFFRPTDVKPGDYYYSDGTIGDGGLRIIEDGNYVFDRAEYDRTKFCVGVVFRIGREDSDLGEYFNVNSQKMNIVRGYVVALNFCMKGDISKEGNPTLNGASNSLSDFQGYYNTQKIGKNSSLLNSFQDFQLACPAQSSGWFIPSYGQMLYMWNMSEFLDLSLAGGGGVEIVSKNQLLESSQVWTSTEQSSGMQYTFDLLTGAATGTLKGNKYTTRPILVF